MLAGLDVEERVHLEFVLATLHCEYILLSDLQEWRCYIATLNFTFSKVCTAVCVIYDHSKWVLLW